MATVAQSRPPVHRARPFRSMVGLLSPWGTRHAEMEKLKNRALPRAGGTGDGESYRDLPSGGGYRDSVTVQGRECVALLGNRHC